MEGGRNMLKDLFENVNSAKLRKTLIVFSVIAFVLGISTVALSVIGFVLVPLLAGIYAYILVVDTTKHKWLSITLSFVFIAGDILVNRMASINMVAVVISGALIALWFIKDDSKAFYVCLSTILLTVLTALSVYLVAFQNVGFDFAAATDLLKAELSQMRELLYETVMKICENPAFVEQAGVIPGETVSAYIDAYFTLIPSYIVIFALISTAISHAIFLAILALCASREIAKNTCAFCTSPVFAVAYVILFIFSIFEGDGGVFNIAMLNLYAVFRLVYAYVGFRFVSFILGRKIKSVPLAVLIVSVATLILSGFVIDVLSAVGVLETFAVARYYARGDDNMNGGNRDE